MCGIEEEHFLDLAHESNSSKELFQILFLQRVWIEKSGSRKKMFGIT